MTILISLSHLCEILIIEGGDPILKVDKSRQQSDPIVSCLIVVLNLSKIIHILIIVIVVIKTSQDEATKKYKKTNKN